tara:strand:+ start:147 stop:497 length:351 start_codon:yes stop_codon:yes gene_type:complete
MKIKLLKSKIHRATVTEANLDYIGSISIDESLMQASKLLEYEQVHVLNVTNGNRLITYVIPAPKNSGEICINGAAAHLVSKGDLVIIVAYGQTNIKEAKTYTPQIIHVDQHNQIIE